MIRFKVPGFEHDIDVFTTRPDTLYGCTYLVLAPEHPFVEKLTAPDKLQEVRAFVKKCIMQGEIERTSEQALKQYRRARAERCLKSNRDFTLRHGAGLDWHIRRSALGSRLETVMEAPDRLLEQRDVQIKDSGRGLPGHGGVLDRFDALLWASVASYFVLKVALGV